MAVDKSTAKTLPKSAVSDPFVLFISSLFCQPVRPSFPATKESTPRGLSVPSPESAMISSQVTRSPDTVIVKAPVESISRCVVRFRLELDPLRLFFFFPHVEKN